MAVHKTTYATNFALFCRRVMSAIHFLFFILWTQKSNFSRTFDEICKKEGRKSRTGRTRAATGSQHTYLLSRYGHCILTLNKMAVFWVIVVEVQWSETALTAPRLGLRGIRNSKSLKYERYKSLSSYHYVRKVQASTFIPKTIIQQLDAILTPQ